VDAALKRFRRLLAIGLWLTAGGALLAIALARLDHARLVESLGSVHVAPLIAALILDVAVVLSKATKWHLVLRPVGRASIPGLLASFYAGAASSAVLPVRLDEFVRAFTAVRFTRLPALPVLGSMVVERLVDFCALLLMLATLAWVLPLPPWLSSAHRYVILGAVILGGGVVMLQLISRRLGDRGGVAGLVHGVAQGTAAARRPGILSLALANTLLEWALTAGVVHLVLVAHGIALPWSASLLLTVLCMGSFALPLAPAGIGVFEVATRMVMPALFDITETEAVGAALTIHALLLVPVVAVGATVIVAGGIRLSEIRRWRDEVREMMGR
jgi:glycosyltransferase 2 family protein